MTLPTSPRCTTYRIAVLVALLAIWGALWLPGLLRGDVLYFRDLLSHDLQWRQEWARQVSAGRLPEWQAATSGGMPLLADPNTQALYPGTLLFLVARGPRAMALFFALHALILGLGANRLLRRLGHSQPAALAGAAFAAGSGIAFSQAVFPNAMASLAWSPWLAWTAAALPADRPGRVRRAALGGVLGALVLLAGEPVLAALGFAMWAAVLATQVRRLPRAGRAVATACLTPLLAAGFAAPLIVPALAAFATSRRSSIGLPPGSFAADAFLPRRWPELLLPHLYGRPGWLAPDGFWAAPSFGWIRYELNLHLGTVALVLILLAVATRRGRRWLLLAAAAALVAASPRALEHAADWVPGLGVVRYAIKALVLSHLALIPAVAAGAVLAARRRRTFRAIALVIALPMVAALILSGSPAMVRRTLSALFPASAADLAAPGVAEHVAAAVRRDALAQLLPLAAAAAAPGLLLVPALAAQLAVEGSSTIMWDDWRVYRSSPQLAHAVAGDPRLVVLLTQGPSGLRAAPTALSSPRFCTRLAWRQLQRYYGELYGVSYRGTVGPDGMEPWWTADCAARLRGSPGDLIPHLARQLGAAWILSSTPMPPTPDIVATTPYHQPADTIFLHRLASPPPAAWLAERTVTVPWRDGAWAQLADPATEPGRDAVLLGPAPETRRLAGGSATVIRSEPGAWTVDVQSAAPGLLVIDQSYSPSWTALVDGAPTTTELVNLWQLGVALPEGGRHRVQIEVSPRPFHTGLLVAGGAGLAALLLLLSGAREGRRSPTYGAEPTPPATPQAR